MDPATFLDNWHIDAICEHLEAVSRGDIRRLIINVPPRHMKSLSVSVAWPAWTWMQKPREGKPLLGPQTRFLGLSYAQTLSIRDNLKCRRLIDSPWYQEQWNERFSLTSDQNTKIRFENDAQGYRIASSVEGTATGEGGDVILIDDPLSANDASSANARGVVTSWWDEVMSTRLNDPKTGAYVIIMQRLHELDLVGHILNREAKEWTHLCLPARYEPDHPHVWKRDPRKTAGELLWPARMGETEIKKLETSLGSYGAAGQLQQRPAPRDGGMFKRRWFGELRDVAPPGLSLVRRWDLASTVATPGRHPDWTAGCKMGRCKDGFFWITDMIRLRGSPHEVETTLLSTARQDGSGVSIGIPQDPGQAGKAQVAALTRMLAGYVVKSAPETGSKEVRASPFAAQCEAGNVRIVKGPWVEAFLAELEVFPNAAFDDQVDVAAGAFNMLADGAGMQGWIDMLAERAAIGRGELPEYAVAVPASTTVAERVGGMPTAFAKYADYIKNTGHFPLSTVQFDDDWEPVGSRVRASLLRAGITIEEGGGIRLK